LAEGIGRGERQLLLITRGFDFASHVVTWGAIVWVASMVRDAFIASVGKTTDVSVLVSLFFSKGNDYGIPWAVAIACILWGVAERKLRQKKTEQLQSRVVELERQLDPNRTSSDLLPSGKSNPRHRV